MQAMLLEEPGAPLVHAEVDRPPRPGLNEVLLRVLACGVCRTDLHVADGELPPLMSDVILGHEVVGEIIEVGSGVETWHPGDRLGVPWLGGTCGVCEQCLAGRENLCPSAVFTGYSINGGFAEWMLADARYCLRIPTELAPATAAPLLCAGLIGYRSYRAAGPDVGRLGLYGFGAAAHLLCQVAVQDGCEVFAFTRPGDGASQAHARSLGASWAGSSDQSPPVPLDAGIIFAPVGKLIPEALRAVRSGGTVVCGGIHMSDIPSFPYSLLWGERTLKSVANLTREDGVTFMERVSARPLHVDTVRFPLAGANEALAALRAGHLTGAAVLVP